MHISLYPPSAATALAALRDMLTRPNRGLPGGIAIIIVPDNGVEFKNTAFMRVCEALAIIISAAQVRDPNGKAHIERFFYILTRGLVQKLSGTTFSNPVARGEYDSAKHACLTLSQVADLIEQWVNEVYHQTVHSRTGRAPILAWEEQATRAGRKRKADHQRDAQQDGIATAEVAELLGISTQQVAVLLRRGILKRTEQIYRPARVERASYWKLARTLQRNDLLSIDAAAELLGVGVPWFRSNWVITGIIKVIDLGIWRFVTRDDVETVRQLRSRYFTATEAGRVLGMHRTHMLNLEKQELVQPLRFGKNKQLRLFERDAVRELVRQQQVALDHPAEARSRDKTSSLGQNGQDTLPSPDEEAANAEPPRLTWESLWTGKLEGWDEAEAVMQAAEAKPATKPAGS